MRTKDYQEVRQKTTEMMNELFTEMGVFWAFGNKQLEEGIAKHKERFGEDCKLVRLPHGGFMPKMNVDELLERQKEIKEFEKKALESGNLKEQHILYELNNYECFYVNDWTEAVNATGYPEQDVIDVFNKYKAEYWEMQK